MVAGGARQSLAVPRTPCCRIHAPFGNRQFCTLAPALLDEHDEDAIRLSTCGLVRTFTIGNTSQAVAVETHFGMFHCSSFAFGAVDHHHLSLPPRRYLDGDLSTHLAAQGPRRRDATGRPLN